MLRSRAGVSFLHDGGGLRFRQGGFTYLELLVTVIVLLVLASALVPIKHWDEKRRKEQRLKIALEVMRGAIDKYAELAAEGKVVPTDPVDQVVGVGTMQIIYPKSLEELVEGVELKSTGEVKPKKLRLLQRIPMDPFTEEAEWGMRSYQDDWDSDSWGRENVYDVYSLSRVTALDGTRYNEW